MSNSKLIKTLKNGELFFKQLSNYRPFRRKKFCAVFFYIFKHELLLKETGKQSSCCSHEGYNLKAFFSRKMFEVVLSKQQERQALLSSNVFYL